MKGLDDTMDLETIASRLRHLWDRSGLEEAEREPLLRLMSLFAGLPPVPDPDRTFPEQSRLRSALRERLLGEDWDALEETFLELYCHLHMYDAPYSRVERQRMNETGGYWCHAGGVSPLLKAGPWIGADTVSADFGAGNGLQGLLFQKLYPHRRTVLIELSGRMVAIGRRLQEWLGIEEDRVEWQIGDVCRLEPPDRLDFVYLYRPVKPFGEGLRFYQKLAASLERSPKGVVIFSIADCLRAYLPAHFQVFYTDGHLTCYRRT